MMRILQNTSSRNPNPTLFVLLRIYEQELLLQLNVVNRTYHLGSITFHVSGFISVWLANSLTVEVRNEGRRNAS